MKLFAVLIAMVLTLTGSSSAKAASGNEVVVIYNSRLPESRAVAYHYALRREVPSNQIWGLVMTTNEVMSRAEFRDSLQMPLFQKLESNGLWTLGEGRIRSTNREIVRAEKMVVKSDIRYAVLCWGVPQKIAPDGSINEPGNENARPEMRRNEAAVDSELAWLPLTQLKLPLSGLMRNPLFGTTNAVALHPTNGLLMVTRLDGPTSELARGLVDKALQAEREGLWGRAYFDIRNTTEPGLKAGDDWIRSAANICRLLGFETVVDSNANTFHASFPMSQIAFYCGWYEPHISGPFAAPKVEFMPGAFAYHLHSFSANSLRSTEQWWAGALVARGVTATMGCVYEPYLPGTPELGTFTSRFIYSAFTFGEAAYAAQPFLSWQVTVVGDPLYRPFGRKAEALQAELTASTNRLVEWLHLRLANINLANGAPPANALNYLESLPLTKQSAVLSEKLGDVCVRLGKPASAVFNYQQALKLNPSPLQRVRLRFALGDMLLAQEDNEKAYENYKSMLTESPGYAGIAAVYQKLIDVAKKTGKNREARQWEEKLKPLVSLPPANSQTSEKK
jgi:uncharacterized protein (TIGR03790 family)